MAALTTKLAEYEHHMEAMEVRKSANTLRAIWVLGNEYLQEAAPWATFKSEPEMASIQVRYGLNLIRLYAVLSAPFIPDASHTMMAAIGSTDWTWPKDMAQALDLLPHGARFDVPDVLFAKISDEQRDAWAAQYSGRGA